MADVRETAETATFAFLPVLATKQVAYLAKNGRYWQGLETHEQTPTGGTARAPTLSRRPTDQAESWSDEGYSIPSRSFSFEVNVYAGPEGHGYDLVCRFRDAGGTWQRTISFGPELSRGHAWLFIFDPV